MDKHPLCKRKGRFTVMADLIKQHPDQVIRALEGILITLAEWLWNEDAVEYAGISEKFDEVLDGLMIPYYIIQSDGTVARCEDVTSGND